MKPRTEDEADMLRYGVSKPEDNCCGNCGWGFPPYNPENDDSYRFCTNYETTKPIGYWCRPWRHFTTVTNGIWPEWCHQDRTRKTTQELLDYHSPENVRKRLALKANPRKWGSRGGRDRYNTPLRELVSKRLKKVQRPLLFYCKECGSGTPHTLEGGCSVCQEYAHVSG